MERRTCYNLDVSTRIQDAKTLETYLWQSFQTPDRAINLSPCVITDDNAVAPAFNCFDSVFGTLNTLEEERSAVSEGFPLCDKSLGQRPV